MRWYLRSKIHNAVVTQADPDYVGSITIDEELIEKADMSVGEKVLVVSNESGSRLETYIIAGERNSGAIEMNGAAALQIIQGEEVIIMGFELSDRPIEPRIVLVDKENRFVDYL
jgi:aspartate 1-decarboxylase